MLPAVVAGALGWALPWAQTMVTENAGGPVWRRSVPSLLAYAMVAMAAVLLIGWGVRAGTRDVVNYGMVTFAIVPAAISQRVGKSGPTEAVMIAVNREWDKLQDIIANSRAAANGYVEAKAVFAAFESMKNGIVPQSDILRFLALELWLRALETWAIRREQVRPKSAEEGFNNRENGLRVSDGRTISRGLR